MLVNDERTNLKFHNPFHQACASGKMEVVKIFLKLYEEQKPQRGQVPRHRKIDLNAKDEHDNTPLIHAIRNQQDAVACELLKAGADPLAISYSEKNNPPMRRRSALLLALSFQDEPWSLDLALHILWKIPPETRCASVNERDYNAGKKTPLMYAAESSRKEILQGFLLSLAKCPSIEQATLQYLIDHGADINEADAGGDLLLQEAVFNGPVKAATTLMECGADLYKPDGKGLFPIHKVPFRRLRNVPRGTFSLRKHSLSDWYYYKHWGNPVYDAFQCLLEYEKTHWELATLDPSDSILMMLGRGRHADIARSLERREVQIQQFIEMRTVEEGETLLHIACRDDCTRLVRKLLEDHQADINFVDYGGNTPLHHALGSETGSLAAVKILMEHLPNLHVTNMKGNTPLFIMAATVDGYDEYPGEDSEEALYFFNIIYASVLQSAGTHGGVVPAGLDSAVSTSPNPNYKYVPLSFEDTAQD